MKRRNVILLSIALIVIFMASSNGLVAHQAMNMDVSGQDENGSSQLVDLGNGDFIDLKENEELHRFVISDQGILEWSGYSSYHDGGEYANSSNYFSDVTLRYNEDNTTTETSLDIPTGLDWEGYYTEATISGLTENRTWIRNPDLTFDSSSWTLSPTDSGGSSTVIASWNATGHGGGDGCFDFFIESDSPSGPYYYDSGDRAYARQTVNVPRGQVVWAAFRTDYWADTRDDVQYGMTGSFSIYVNVEYPNTGRNYLWETVFSDIGAEETWYDSGLVPIPASTFALPSDNDTSVEVGLWSKQSVGYTPDILPAAKIDNFVLYIKTQTTPSSVNLQMDGKDVTDSSGFGSGFVSEYPLTAWSSNPIALNFSWTPTPVNPNPNKTITIEFDLDVNMFARKTTSKSVFEINPVAFGEKYTITNGSDGMYSTYFFSDIPTGYVNRYFFNMTIPENRDVYFVAKPLAPASNLTTGWNGGQSGDGYLNVSAYEIATEAGRFGYWRILSDSPNMISDIELSDPSTSLWSRFVDLRAGNSTQIRAYLGTSYVNSVVNFTIFDPDGEKWYSVNATTDGSGYATTTSINFAGNNASAGSWMIQAICNDVGTNIAWRSNGFFKRPFSVTHTSALTINYPDDAVGTWEANVTYGDLLLLIVTANDTDSDVIVPGGTLTLDWILGTDTFDDSKNGQYTKVIDTSFLGNKGQYIIDLEWTAASYDTANAILTVNVNYDAEITSPDYPGIQGPIGNEQSFVVDFKNVNGTGILGASISTNWTGSESVLELGLGQYEISLDATGMAIGVYPILVYANAPFVEPQEMLMFVEIREIYNTIRYSANQLSIPVGESASFTIEWYDTDNGQPVAGMASSITCNWTSFHSLGEQNYTISESSPGVYEVTLHTEVDDPLTAENAFYNVNFAVALKDYQNHTFSIGVQVRRHNTLFVLDTPVEQTPISQEIVILVYYQDTDLLKGIKNISGFVDFDITTSDVSSLAFSSSISSYGDGHYNITISSSQWSTIGWKNLTITASWTGGDTYYSQVLDIRVRLLGTETDLFLEIAPTATNYLNNFTFTLVYYDIVNATRISNSTDDVFILMTPLTTGHSVTQSDFVIFEIGTSGTYSFEINASLFGSAQTFKFQVDFLWSSGVSPLYENQTISISLIVLGIPTYIDYTPVESTPYGEFAEFSFSYVNSLTSVKIANSSSMSINLVEGGISYSVTYDSGTRIFTISINTTSLAIGTSVLTLNVVWLGEPYYEQELQTFSVSVTLRSTQLSHLSFATPQWGDVVSIEFIYTDLITGSSSDMTGTLSLDAGLAGYYTVSSLGNGHYLLELDTTVFSGTGVFFINATIAYTGSNFAADAIESFSLSVIERVAQMGYESPDPTEFLNNVTFTITYIDDSTSTPIPGASLTITCSNSSSTLLLNDNYWFTDLGTGEYLIEIESVALGSVGIFILEVTASKSGIPYHASVVTNIKSIVTQRTTQILLTQTPGEVPFLEFVVIKFKYTDFLTGQSITITELQITLTHGVGMTVISDSNYTLSESNGVYTITFNSTILNPSALVTAYPIQITIDASSGSPFYAPRSIETKATTKERATQILFPLVEDTPYYENITINFQFIDFLTGNGIPYASVSVDISNMTTPTHYISEIGNGLYKILIPSQQFGSVGTIYFNVSVSTSGTPFYGDRAALMIPAKIILVPTTLIAEVPAVASQPIGQPILVNLTLTSSATGTSITGATITTDWTSLFSTDATILEIGGGIYRITINTTGLLSQEYEFSIQAELAFHVTSNISVSVTPGAASSQIILSKTTIYADWGELISISLDVRDPIYGTYIPGMNTTILWNGTLYHFTDLLNGTYTISLDTTDNNFGVYQPQITISREYYQPKQTTMTFIISKADGELISEQTVLTIITGATGQFWIYLNDTARDLPIEGAVVSMEWNNTFYNMPSNGTPGYYVGSLNSSGFALGQYELIISAVQTNYIILDQTLDVYIDPIPITISLPSLQTGFVVYYGEMLELMVSIDDDYNGGLVRGANISYTLAGLSGQLLELPNGSYTATIDTSLLAAQILYLRLTVSIESYETKVMRYLVNIQPIPTSISVDLSSKIGYYGDTVTYVFSLNDSLTNTPLSGAQVDVSWEGGTGEAIDHGDGTYSVSIHLNASTPKAYDVNVRFVLTNYATADIKVRADLDSFPISILGLSEVSIAINDTLTLHYSLNNTVLNQIVSDASGIANWVGLEQVVLDVDQNGSYILVIPNDLILGQYTIDLSFANPFYQIAPFQISLTVRQVNTDLVLAGSGPVINTLPGDPIEITITYRDLDHENRSIPNAIISYTVTSDNGNFVVYYPNFLRNPLGDNGTYILYFIVQAGGIYELTIQFSRGDYAAASINLEIDSNPTPEQVLIQTATYGGGALLILISVLLFYYVRVWSVPKQIRSMNRMIKSLEKGVVPRPGVWPSRQEALLSIVNEELHSSGIRKISDDVAGESIEAHIPEVNKLLERLAEITGLGAVEIEAFKADLAKMKASERPGFIREVITQEEARRADALARAKEPDREFEVPSTLEARPEELDEIRQKLVTKGMAPEEIDVILEEAKNLSKADLEALLDSLGIRLD